MAVLHILVAHGVSHYGSDRRGPSPHRTAHCTITISAVLSPIHLGCQLVAPYPMHPWRFYGDLTRALLCLLRFVNALFYSFVVYNGVIDVLCGFFVIVVECLHYFLYHPLFPNVFLERGKGFIRLIKSSSSVDCKDMAKISNIRRKFKDKK